MPCNRESRRFNVPPNIFLTPGGPLTTNPLISTERLIAKRGELFHRMKIKFPSNRSLLRYHRLAKKKKGEKRREKNDSIAAEMFWNFHKAAPERSTRSGEQGGAGVREKWKKERRREREKKEEKKGKRSSWHEFLAKEEKEKRERERNEGLR